MALKIKSIRAEKGRRLHRSSKVTKASAPALCHHVSLPHQLLLPRPPTHSLPLPEKRQGVLEKKITAPLSGMADKSKAPGEGKGFEGLGDWPVGSFYGLRARQPDPGRARGHGGCGVRAAQIRGPQRPGSITSLQLVRFRYPIPTVQHCTVFKRHCGPWF